MRHFHDAFAVVIAELTPQPWHYTTPDGTTLTIEPHGLPAHKDEAEVVFQIGDLTEWVRTPDVQNLVDALTAGESWTYESCGWGLDVLVAEGGVIVALRQDDVVSVSLPAGQRMPLVSAIRRALDVARGWEREA